MKKNPMAHTDTELRTCCKQIYGPRVHSWDCLRKGTVCRKGKWYCKQHDPEQVLARRADRDAVYRTEQQAEESIVARAEVLAKRLGCGIVHYQTRFRGKSGYTESLVITFTEAEYLISMLKGIED